ESEVVGVVPEWLKRLLCRPGLTGGRLMNRSTPLRLPAAHRSVRRPQKVSLQSDRARRQRVFRANSAEPWSNHCGLITSINIRYFEIPTCYDVQARSVSMGRKLR